MSAASCACALTGWCLLALQSARPCSLENQPTVDRGAEKVKARCRCLVYVGWSWSPLAVVNVVVRMACV